MRGGRLGRDPMASTTASGNFAGCAVAMETTGTSGSSDFSARIRTVASMPMALCGSSTSPVAAWVALIRAVVAVSSTPVAANNSWARSSIPCETEKLPVSRKPSSSRAVTGPSRSCKSNSRRSKLLETWISMLGDSDGFTPRISMVPVLKNRERMSLALVATTSFSIGSPSAWAA